MMMQAGLQPEREGAQDAGQQREQASPPRTTRVVVEDLRVQTGEAGGLGAERGPGDGASATQLVQRADAAVEKALWRATEGLPSWTLPAAGAGLIFVGAALLTRGVLARRAARDALDPRERAWQRVRRLATRDELGAEGNADASQPFAGMGLVAMRILRRGK